MIDFPDFQAVMMIHFKAIGRLTGVTLRQIGSLLCLVILAVPSAGCNLYRDVQEVGAEVQYAPDIGIAPDTQMSPDSQDGIDVESDVESDDARVNEDTISVADYGALANADFFDSATLAYYSDAEFSLPAFDATDAIQSAIDDAVAIGKSEVYIPPGNYLIRTVGQRDFHVSEFATRGGIQMRSGITLTMSSQTTLVMNPTDQPGYAFISIDQKEDVVIRGGKLQGDRLYYYGDESQYAMGISISNGSKRVRIENVEVAYCENTGIEINDYFDDGRRIESIIIQGVESYQNGDLGIYIGSGKDITVRDSSVHHHIAKETRVGLLAIFRNADAGGLSVVNNTFTDNAHGGVWMRDYDPDNPALVVSNIEIRDNYIQGSQVGIKSETRVDGLMILENTIDTICAEQDFCVGIINDSLWSENVSVSNNTITGEVTEMGYMVGIYSWSMLRVLIQANILKGADLGIWVGGDDAVITGNQIREFRDEAIHVSEGEHTIEDNDIYP